jgi:uncharacterized protein YndB with AHSA1/START domain
MSARPPLAQELLLIADLSGYTGYLANAEPEEAPLIAGDLVETVVASLVPPFRLAGLEGDAAFLHVDPALMDGPGLLAVIASTYEAFRHRVESLRLATSCECSACRTVPDLDLKFFVHVGTVLHQRIAGRDELAGREVILVHRLMKDSAPAQSGATSYALITAAAVDALAINPAEAGLRAVSQEYEHLGVVDAHVLDVRSGWERGHLRAPGKVDAPVVAEARMDLPATPAALWELLTSARGRQSWEGIETVEALSPDAPTGVGSLSRCVARHLTTLEEIIDWRPPHGLARRTELPAVGPAIVTYALEPTTQGTSLTVRWHGTTEAEPGVEVSAALPAMLDRLALAVSR